MKQRAAAGRGEVEVILYGHFIGRREFTQQGWQTLRFPLDPAPAGGFGFVPSEEAAP